MEIIGIVYYLVLAVVGLVPFLAYSIQAVFGPVPWVTRIGLTAWAAVFVLGFLGYGQFPLIVALICFWWALVSRPDAMSKSDVCTGEESRQRQLKNFEVRAEPAREPDFEGEKTIYVTKNGRQEYSTSLAPHEARELFDLLRAEFIIQVKNS